VRALVAHESSQRGKRLRRLELRMLDEAFSSRDTSAIWLRALIGGSILPPSSRTAVMCWHACRFASRGAAGAVRDRTGARARSVCQHTRRRYDAGALCAELRVVDAWRGRLVHMVMADDHGRLHRVKIVDPPFLTGRRLRGRSKTTSFRIFPFVISRSTSPIRGTICRQILDVNRRPALCSNPSATRAAPHG
jgi:hypothetical protein